MTSHLLTFIVPTRNRQHCLKSLLDIFHRFFIMGENYFKVVILDNSDNVFDMTNLGTMPFMLEYYHSNENLSVVENFNKGVQYVDGEFACFIGDDDLISFRVFEFVRLMKQQKIEAAIVSENTKAIYFWPGVSDRRWGSVGSKLFLNKYSGKVLISDVKDAIELVSIRCCDGPQSLPRAYSGIISKNAIDRVVKKHGNLFGGCSPDIYSSRLLASVISTVAYVDLPLIAAGASPASTSAARASRSDIGGLTDNDHLSRFQHLEWDERIPKFYSPFTVWAQSYLQAEKQLGIDISNRALAFVYAKCILFARGNFSHIKAALKRSDNKLIIIYYLGIYVISLPFFFLISKMNLLLHRKPGGCAFEYTMIENSSDASQALDEAIASIPFLCK
ncbi:glycosyltransferase family 2 protein [Vogesella mureinivorans]|uniref:glycosyltransferase family 2 protein n=1 Tax=Vogesella mureinivorans TaxID=657276 RepID=UPI0011CC7F4C|nr:glycosyltransferase [Vogesella mureinivorans]